MSAREEQELLWGRLAAAGVVAGGETPPSVPSVPWFVRLMLGIAGWIGASFLLLFVGVGMEFLLDLPALAFVVGLGACAVAGWLLRAGSRGEFASQFALAVSLAGQGLVLYALFEVLEPRMSAVALGMAAFQGVLFAAVPSTIHRVWTAWTGTGAVVLALVEWQLQAYAPGLLALACAWVWLDEFRFPRHGSLVRSGGYGLTLALMGAVGVAVGHLGVWLGDPGFGRSPGDLVHQWIGAGLGGIALLWAVWRLLVREGVARASRTGAGLLAAAGIVALAGLEAPGLPPAVLVLLLGQAGGNRLLLGLGVLALLGYLSFYYYSLETTLLVKSALMAATGLSLLAARLVLHAMWPAPVPGEDGHA